MNLKKIFIFLFLFSCGFRPMHQDMNIDIFVEPIKSGINGIDLRNALNAKFGASSYTNTEYRILVNLSEPMTQYKGIEPTGDATWQEVTLQADYTLFKNDKEIAKGREVASDSYSIVRYLIAANAVYNNSIKNAITILSEKIATSVYAEIYSNQK